MFAWFAVLSTLSLSLASTPAGDPDAIATRSDPRGAQALQQVGHCVARERRETSAEFVTIDHRSERYRSLSKRLGEFAPECNAFRRGLRASGLIFAGTVAEGLLVDSALIDALGEATAHDPARAPIAARSAEEVMAYCVVRKAPEAVAELLKTPMISAEELASLKAMAEVLPTCVPQGQQPSFNRESLRALLALGAYRLAAHNGRTN